MAQPKVRDPKYLGDFFVFDHWMSWKIIGNVDLEFNWIEFGIDLKIPILPRLVLHVMGLIFVQNVLDMF